MTAKASEKIIDALNQLLEGYAELQRAIEREFSGEAARDEEDEEEDKDEEEKEVEVNPEVDAAMVTEIRAALENVFESEDYSPEDFALVISTITDALEEIDPDVFESGEEVAVDEEEAEEEEDDDYEEIEDEDDDYDFDEDEEEDEKEETDEEEE